MTSTFIAVLSSIETIPLSVRTREPINGKAIDYSLSPVPCSLFSACTPPPLPCGGPIFTR